MSCPDAARTYAERHACGGKSPDSRARTAAESSHEAPSASLPNDASYRPTTVGSPPYRKAPHDGRKRACTHGLVPADGGYELWPVPSRSIANVTYPAAAAD